MSKSATQAAQKVLEAFRSGAVVRAAELVFVERKLAADAPCRRWSLTNRFFAALSGSADARTFHQWLDVQRAVRKGEKASGFIFLPVFGRGGRTTETEHRAEPVEEQSDEQPVTFLLKPVFGYHQTDGEPIPDYVERERFLDHLPLIDVARAWGIPVHASHELLGRGILGVLAHDPDTEKATIGLAAENPEVFLHELCHAAEKRLGTLKGGEADRPGKEVVAEFGAQILLAVLDLPTATDSAYAYLESYAKKLELSVETAALRFLERTITAVDLILKTARELEGEVALDGADESLAA